MILGFEEPELFQHPPQAQHLSDILQTIAEQASQVIVCTHSPYFVSGRGFEDVRIVRKSYPNPYSRVAQLRYEELAEAISAASGSKLTHITGQKAKIHQALQPSLNEMFFTPFLLLVEGQEDIAYIASYMHISGRWNDWRNLGGHMVATGGKSSLIQPVAVALILEIPTFVVFDSDGHTTDKSGSRTKHEKDNRTILSLITRESDPEPFPLDNFWGTNVVMWKSEIGEIIAEDYGVNQWNALGDRASINFGHAGGLEKNSLYIAERIGLAWHEYGPSSILDKLCDRIFAAAPKLETPYVDY